MKTLSEKQFSFNSDAHWSHKSTVFFHDEEIESKTDSLNRKACDVQFLHWISDKQKKSDRQIF